MQKAVLGLRKTPGAPMAFNKSGRGNDDRGPRRSFGSDRPRFSERPASAGRSGTRSFGKPRGGDLELFDVKCAKCGIDTKVPFKPTGERPVLCRDCFKNDGAAPRKSFSSPAAGPSASDIREINEKLDKIMAALDIE